MGIVSLGRSLIIRQLLLAGLVVAFGIYAYLTVGGIQDMARLQMTGDASAGGNAAAIVAATQSAAWQIVVATCVAVFLMVAVSVPVIHYTIGRPVKRLADAVEHIATGDFAVEIQDDARNDELGIIARSLCRLRDSAVVHAQEAAAARLATVDDSREKAMVARVERFAVDLAGSMKRLGTMTRKLSDASGTMIAAMRQANVGSESATTASVEAAGDVSSVATASEQLLDSIEEISRQVVQSTNVVKLAVERAVETNTGMGRLSAAAQKVGDVVSLISRIAAQTNLLALNATIEAARAGEAGRGFAVVAQEVKTLATQTAKATQDITGQIAEMQQATDLSVEAIDKIQHKISEVEHISTIIAAAVHEQGAATQEIARNVRSAAAGTTSMSTHIEHVVRSVDETSHSAESMATLARELDDVAKGITEMLTSFTKSLKAA